jgi:hypothetical protein
VSARQLLLRNLIAGLRGEAAFTQLAYLSGEEKKKKASALVEREKRGTAKCFAREQYAQQNGHQHDETGQRPLTHRCGCCCCRRAGARGAHPGHCGRTPIGRRSSSSNSRRHRSGRELRCTRLLRCRPSLFPIRLPVHGCRVLRFLVQPRRWRALISHQPGRGAHKAGLLEKITVALLTHLEEEEEEAALATFSPHGQADARTRGCAQGKPKAPTFPQERGGPRQGTRGLRWHPCPWSS